jgi:hypothetical protein
MRWKILHACTLLYKGEPVKFSGTSKRERCGASLYLFPYEEDERTIKFIDAEKRQSP